MSDQFIVTGVVRPTTKNTETLSFSFVLGPLKIVCIANIPEEGDTAPVYVKLQLPNENGDYPSKQVRRRPLTDRLDEQAKDHVAYGQSPLDDDGEG
jgi:hypothetical protein